ncbi:transporter [Alteromonas aestuariivivens]|uniref:Transporter n=1 Tax=Alteromonas aestuariivivens TaxID=1938339 RepID=A0A3D8MDC0_9ALTE|nr:transporter [Alteromonas aestuariivivens]
MLTLLFVFPFSAQGQDSAELAQQLSNPVASLISVPLQTNFDDGFGSNDEGYRYNVNVQPVIPFSLNDEYNLISRTIMPLTYQHNIVAGAGSQTGLGDVVQSLFFSPKAPTASGWIWGAGPVFLLPTGTEKLLSGEKWGVGPTAVMLKQNQGWTYGALANHIESFAGDSNRADISLTFVQPFLVYNTPDGTSYALNFESSYDWEASELSLPVNLMVNKVLKVRNQLVQVGGGVRYWVDSPEGAADGWGLRFNLVFLFPK